jgi:mannose-6-phosphate isomerase-like protein (cupin superfamily)
MKKTAQDIRRNKDGDSGATLTEQGATSKRWYYDVAIGSLCLSGQDTGGSYSLFELSLGSGKGVARHTHTREEEAYYVLSGELEVVVGDRPFILRAGDTLVAPRNIPHALRNPGNADNHYLNFFSPSGFEGFLQAISVPAPDGAAAPSEAPAIPVQNVGELFAEYGIRFLR